MNEFILTLILVSPTGITTHEVDIPGDTTLERCEQVGESYVGEYIPGTGRVKWFVTGYGCDSDGVVEHNVYPFQYQQEEQAHVTDG